MNPTRQFLVLVRQYVDEEYRYQLDLFVAPYVEAAIAKHAAASPEGLGLDPVRPILWRRVSGPQFDAAVKLEGAEVLPMTTQKGLRVLVLFGPREPEEFSPAWMAAALGGSWETWELPRREPPPYVEWA